MSQSAPPATVTIKRDDTAEKARRVSLIVLFIVFMLGVLASAVFVIWKFFYFTPPSGLEVAADVVNSYDFLRNLRENSVFPAATLYIGAPGYAISGVGIALFIALLGTANKWWRLSLVGAVLAGVAGIIFPLFVVAEVFPWSYAVDTNVFPEARGREVFEAIHENVNNIVPIAQTILSSLIVSWVGILLGLIAALLGRSAPRWFLFAAFGYIIIFVVLPTSQVAGPIVQLIGELLNTALSVGIGWFGLRAALRLGLRSVS